MYKRFIYEAKKKVGIRTYLLVMSLIIYVTWKPTELNSNSWHSAVATKQDSSFLILNKKTTTTNKQNIRRGTDNCPGRYTFGQSKRGKIKASGKKYPTFIENIHTDSAAASQLWLNLFSFFFLFNRATSYLPS